MCRDDFQNSMAELGISTLIHYPAAPHLSGAYEEAGWRLGDSPVAEQIAQTELSLPMGPHLAAQDRDFAIKAVRQPC